VEATGNDAGPIITSTGERVALGPLRRDLIPLLTRWVNDLAITRNIGFVTPITIEQETAWYEQMTSDPSEITFLLYERATMRPVGTTGLSHIQYGDRSAMFGIFIGEPDARGRGYGTEATRLLLDYAFTALGLHNVGLEVAEWNVVGQRAYTRAGFRVCGRRRQCWQMGGRHWDEIHMD
jgi:diamine N-acetyltransferase